MWVVVLALFAIIAVLLVAFVWALDRGDAARQRRSSSVPTITSLPRQGLEVRR